MSEPQNLEDLYIEELGDLWSANDQMLKIVKQMAEKTTDGDLGDRLETSADGIQKHTDTIKSLLKECGESDAKEHCKGMEGLVKEAKKHALEADINDGEVRDVVLISQYQRMCHYGIAGFGTAAAFADALEKKDHADTLREIVEEIYSADDYMSDLAERSVNLNAKQ